MYDVPSIKLTLEHFLETRVAKCCVSIQMCMAGCTRGEWRNHCLLFRRGVNNRQTTFYFQKGRGREFWTFPFHLTPPVSSRWSRASSNILRCMQVTGLKDPQASRTTLVAFGLSMPHNDAWFQPAAAQEVWETNPAVTLLTYVNFHSSTRTPSQVWTREHTCVAIEVLFIRIYRGSRVTKCLWQLSESRHVWAESETMT